MKIRVHFLALLCLVFIGLSCSDKNYYELSNLYYDGGIFHSDDAKATKIASAASIFDGISRNPEASQSLIAAGKSVFGGNYTTLLPLNNGDFTEDRALARGIALAGLFNSLARQPEAYAKLDSAAEVFLGHFQQGVFPEASGWGRGVAVKGLFDAIGRQPEAYGKLDSIAEKYLGTYATSGASQSVIDYAASVALVGLTENITRQPEAIDLLRQAERKYLNK